MAVPTFVKRRPDAPDLFFEAEAAGLRWLSEAEPDGGARVVEVIGVWPGVIELERIREARPTADAARAFGAGLAITHLAGAEAFGAPPEHWRGPLYIGGRQLPVASESSWGRFYARHRILPYLPIAVEAGSVSPAQLPDIERATARIASGELDDEDPPARIHGDLWHGNLLWDKSGGVLIDPAAHGGHRETDLAMLALFGCPYFDEIVAGYEAAAWDRGRPLLWGWQDRIPLHQLHPLAVHAASYGPSYGHALHEAALATLALAS
ncbi:phosphotransferase [Diaminobutyricibacter tongyongensis]|uniref:Phosphotransferase n=1 Tax=Leifsonia tongyongensis TaxID=1268043 RepID=A0A6L9Y1V6_9MICO|nr:fructosamine kinase family protein [Diaminobutyricibacter tongyongensis]NEN07505.1 phosphotransferase [Diaminobutyricibacter tongyongensis]